MTLPLGLRYAASLARTGSGSSLPAFHLRNPAGSGVVVYLYGVTVGELGILTTDSKAGWSSGRKDSALSGSPTYAVAPTTTSGEAPASKAEFASVASAVFSDGATVGLFRAVTPRGGTRKVDLRRRPIILAPGTGYVVKKQQRASLTTDNTVAGFEWVEVET